MMSSNDNSESVQDSALASSSSNDVDGRQAEGSSSSGMQMPLMNDEPTTTPKFLESDLTTPLMFLEIENPECETTLPASHRRGPRHVGSGSSSAVGSELFEWLTPGRKMFLLIGAFQVTYWIYRKLFMDVLNHHFHPTYHDPTGGFSYMATIGPVTHSWMGLLVGVLVAKHRRGTVLITGNNNDATTDDVQSYLWYAPAAIAPWFAGKCARWGFMHSNFVLFTMVSHAKIIPVMLGATYLLGSFYPPRQYIEAVVIFVGLNIFSAPLERRFGDNELSFDFLGILWLFVFLVVEAFSFPWLEVVLNKFGRIDPFDMLLKVSVTSVVLTTGELFLASEELATVVEFLKANPSVLKDTLGAAILSTSTQLIILCLLRDYGSVTTITVVTIQPMIQEIVSDWSGILTFWSVVSAAIVLWICFVQFRRDLRKLDHEEELGAAVAEQSLALESSMSGENVIAFSPVSPVAGAGTV